MRPWTVCRHPRALAVGPAVRVDSLDPAVVPVAAVGAKPDSGHATMSTDPTLNLTQAAALILNPPPRTAPAPLLLLPIPDPSRQAAYVPTDQPENEDAPTPSFERQPLPALMPDK